MSVSGYNKGRSVADLTPKTWKDGARKNLRPDSYWSDDRYNPSIYRHPSKQDNINFPDMEYKDLFGGTWGDQAKKEKERHTLEFWKQKSDAMRDYQRSKSAK